MRPTRICDVVCSSLWDHPDVDGFTLDDLPHSPLFSSICCHPVWIEKPSASKIISVISRTPGLLVKEKLSNRVRFRPPWPIATRNEIVSHDVAIKDWMDYRFINEKYSFLVLNFYEEIPKDQLKNKNIGHPVFRERSDISELEVRRHGWLRSARASWIKKKFPGPELPVFDYNVYGCL